MRARRSAGGRIKVGRQRALAFLVARWASSERHTTQSAWAPDSAMLASAGTNMVSDLRTSTPSRYTSAIVARLSKRSTARPSPVTVARYQASMTSKDTSSSGCQRPRALSEAPSVPGTIAGSHSALGSIAAGSGQAPGAVRVNAHAPISTGAIPSRRAERER